VKTGKKKNVCEVESQHWSHFIGLDSLFQKTLITTPKIRTVQPRDALEDTALEPGFEIVTF
jgi:hypothetical protein